MRTSRIIGSILAAGLALDLLSIIGWSVPAWVTPITVALLVVVATLTLIDVRLGVVAVLLELLWGSHGYLLKIPAGGLNVSLRMGIFLVVLGATVWHFRQRDARAVLWQTFRSHPVRWPALVFLATLALGLVLGFLRHSFDRVFFDANAWGMLVLAPAFILARTRMTRISRADDVDTRIETRRNWSFAPIFLAGALYLILRTYLLLFVFSHDLGGFWLAAYQWVRDTRLGEVTIFPGAFPRVFLPSMVLLFPAALLAATRMTRMYRADDADTRMPHASEEETKNNFSPSFRGGARGSALQGFGWLKGRSLPMIVFGGSVALLLLSLSRSYWLAGLALFAIGIASASMHLWRGRLSQFRAKLRKELRDTLVLGGAVVIAIGAALVVVRLPYPKPLTTAGVGETLLARFSADAAVSNRWQQIGPLRDAILQHPILGNGFGAAVAYKTRDPRTLAAYPDGKYTTTAFEWGYLDDLLERGLLGLLAELWLLSSLIWHGLRSGLLHHSTTPPLNYSYSLSFGLLAIAIVHATSPYLNHPLGIGLLLWLFAMEAPRTPEGERGVMSAH